MLNFKRIESGFTLIEIAIVLVIVAVLLGYSIAMFPIQQELKQYRKADAEMDKILSSIIGFAQVNGRLPCPSWPNTKGLESGGGDANCTSYTSHAIGEPWIGFVPVNTLGLDGKINKDGLLLDPWGNPYRYYVTDSDFFEDADDPANNDLSDFGAGTSPDGDGFSDFVVNGEMRDIGLNDRAIDENNNGDDDVLSDGYVDLDPNLIICDSASALADRCTATANQVVGNVSPFTFATGVALVTGGPVYGGAYDTQSYTAYGGVPVVLISLGKNGSGTATGDELENKGALRSFTDLAMPNGPSGTQYIFDRDTVFVRRTTGAADAFDDIVKWISPNVLFSKMIEAGKLP